MASSRTGYLAIKIQPDQQTPVKPTHFLSYLAGDIKYNKEVIQTNAIQATRWLNITAVEGKVNTPGDYTMDVDVREIGYWLHGALGSDTITSAGSGAYKHLFTPSNSLPAFTIEQAKGNLENEDEHVVERSFGVFVDTIELKANDGTVEAKVDVKALGQFNKGGLVADEIVEASSTNITAAVAANGYITFTSTAHGLPVNSVVVVAGVTPSGYNGTYTVLEVPTANSFKVVNSATLGAYSTGGTATRKSTLLLQQTEGLIAGDTLALRAPGKTTEAISPIFVDGGARNIGLNSISGTFTKAEGAKVEIIPQTPDYSTPQKLFSFVHASFYFGDTLAAAALAQEENVENWTFTYKNNLEERFGSKRKTPSRIAPKGASAMIKYTKFFENKLDRDRYLDQTKRACILKLQLEETIASTSVYYSLVVKMPDVRFTSHDMPTGTDDLYITELEATLFFDRTEGNGSTIELYNDVADYTA